MDCIDYVIPSGFVLGLRCFLESYHPFGIGYGIYSDALQNFNAGFIQRYNPLHGHISHNSRFTISHHLVADAGLYKSFPRIGLHHPQFA